MVNNTNRSPYLAIFIHFVVIHFYRLLQLYQILKTKYTLLVTLNYKSFFDPRMCTMLIVLFSLFIYLFIYLFIHGFYRHSQHQILGSLVINERERMGKYAVFNYLEVLRKP